MWLHIHWTPAGCINSRKYLQLNVQWTVFKIENALGDDGRQVRLWVPQKKRAGLLIKWGPEPACRVPSADTFTLTNLHWLTLWWQILDTSCARKPIQPTFNSYSFLMISNLETAKVTLKAEFQYSSNRRWISGALTKCVLGSAPWCLCSEEAFGDNWVIQTGSSGYQLHSGEQRARSGTNHTTWPHTPSVCVCVSER